MTNSIGERMKSYEAASDYRLTPNSCVFIRVDGRAFHTYTRDMDRPFDRSLMAAMVGAARMTAGEMQGFKLGYVQSDEATFMLTDYDTHQTQGWFGYELNKLVSLSASLFTGYFNQRMPEGPYPAAFDSRAFVVPRADAPNVFVWRQRDWERNSLQMLAQAHFSHRQLHGKKRADLHDMLHGIGVNWATDLNEQEKNGTFILRDGTYLNDQWTYADIDQYLGSMIDVEREAA
ncbi:tRNA(His) guanylyltransferase Thg1 family protein [Nocardia niwae]|uniref:tRNA(His) guanylyltransferase Thg1 family protein n=1 Tax=Nocardia niwae TaxID=626084 RepID=UPI0007A4E256|nr:tRNA(His) guanylyltransferase Thg1 family protein [Nocardia niwae]